MATVTKYTYGTPWLAYLNNTYLLQVILCTISHSKFLITGERGSLPCKEKTLEKGTATVGKGVVVIVIGDFQLIIYTCMYHHSTMLYRKMSRVCCHGIVTSAKYK